MTDAEKLIASLRDIGFEPVVRDVSYTEGFRGLAAPREIRQRVNVGFHFLFDEDGKLAGVESEYDGWVTSTSENAIAVVGYRTECVNGLGSRVTAVDLVFRDATHARKLLTLREYHDGTSGRTLYVLPGPRAIRDDGVVHTIHFRHANSR
jgi:hypothetical protein